MGTVVEISDNEDSDDCVINSVTFIGDDELDLDFYNELSKENKLLADFISKCYHLENSRCMQKVIKENLLKHYYAADKTMRESPKFQKNLRRANNLLKTDPCHKFTHIKDLCNILRSAKVKKRVPFVTLSNNFTDKNCKPINKLKLKRNNTDPLSVTSTTSKIAKLSESVSDVLNNASNITGNMETCTQHNKVTGDSNDTSNIIHTSITTETCNQQNKVTGDSNDTSNIIHTSITTETCNQQNKVTGDSNNTSNIIDASITMETCTQQNEVTRDCNNTSDMLDASITIETSMQQNEVTRDCNNTSDMLDTSITMETSMQQNEVTRDCNDTSDMLDASITMETSMQQSEDTEENKLLIPTKEVPINIFPTPVQKRLKVIENKLSYYKRKIAVLDEQEVDDDSLESPYIKSERLKSKIVMLYMERCQILGSQPQKCKGIRLKLLDGHPPGPIKTLERFLNKNCSKDGYPPFPDFSEVITCVTEANDKDSLGWTKAQIMNEATTLFTLCGRALQKRRQNREYQDLVSKVKMEDLDRDPADDDPELKAKLEENKRIAVKKESEVLERYTMMQYLPPKSKLQKHTTTLKTTENDVDGAATIKSADQELINNKNGESSGLETDVTERSYGQAIPKSCRSIMNAPYHNSDEERLESQNSVQSKNDVSLDTFKMVVDNEIRVPDPLLPHNVDRKVDDAASSSGVKDSCNNIIHSKLISNGASLILKSVGKDKPKKCILSRIVNKEKGSETNNLKVINNQSQEKHIDGQLKKEVNGNVMKMFNQLEKKTTVVIEIMSSDNESIESL